ncbi:MAG TPA: hypothetical protein VMU24_02185 [Candidatus Acidoferrales bacterium]|nr:hypothetical protein [Candidatus Acidoferrales bacterium]
MDTKKYLLPSLLTIFLVTIGLLAACNHSPDTARADALNAQPAATAANPQPAPNAAPTGGDDARPFATREQPKPSAAQAEPVVIPAGTNIAVSLQTAVSSAQSNAGDRFEAVLATPLKVNGDTVVPAGTPVTGRVTDAESSGRLEHPGHISLTLVSMTLNGHALPISTSTVSAQGQSHKGRNVKWIGGGAAGGALLGGIFGGGKGALIGSAVGASGGTAAAAATGKKDVGFGVEHRLNFRLAQSVTVQK